MELEYRTATASASVNCVEVAIDGDMVYVRDSKHRDAGPQVYTRAEWAAFISGIKDGEFDR